MFFKALKSGCKVEELQFETLKGTVNCITLYMIVAWRILYVTILGRRCPDIDCNVFFDDNEQQAVYSVIEKKQPPKEPLKLGEMISMIAKLGGFLGRKSDGEPGTQVMWIGMQRMRDFTLAWETFQSLHQGVFMYKAMLQTLGLFATTSSGCKRKQCEDHSIENHQELLKKRPNSIK